MQTMVGGGGSINLKLGYDFENIIWGHAAFNMEGVDYDATEMQFMTAAPSIGAEYLFSIPFGESGKILYPGFLKFGVGVQYLFTRTSFEPVVTEEVSLGEDFSFLPIYAIIQLNPEAQSGLFFKGMAGYSLLLQQDKAEEYDWGKKGGLHWGLAIGYESSWGFFVEYAYTQTYSTLEVSADAMGPGSPSFDIDFEYAKSSISIGYKFKL